MLRRVLPVLAVFIASCPAQETPFSAARQDVWKVLGPGGGGAQFNPTICPTRPDRVYVTSDMSGSFVSDDGGSTWRMFNLHGTATFAVCDPVNADIAYIANTALWRTANGGRTWQMVYPAPSNLKGIRISGDHAEEYLITADGSDNTFRALAVDPADSNRLYAVIAGSAGWFLTASTDWGKTWTNLRPLGAITDQPLGNHTVRVIIDPNSPVNDRRIYVVGLNSVTVRDGGIWKPLPAPPGVGIFNNVGFGFSGSGRLVIYAVAGQTWYGGENKPASAWKSIDGGASWQRIDANLFPAISTDSGDFQFRAVAACFTKPDIAYVSYRFYASASAGVPGLMGVAKTVDGGRTWSLVWRDTDNAAGPNIHDGWLNQRYGPSWGENPFQLEVSRANPDVVFGGDFGRTMRTTDGGATWQGVYSRTTNTGNFATAGLDLTSVYSVHFDPSDLNRIFAGYTDIGLMLSEDGGTTWNSATRVGVPRAWVNTAYWLEFDPDVKGRIWAVMSGTHDLPRPKMWRSTDPSTYKGGVVTSTDGGRTWSSTSSTIGETAATYVLLDPTSPAGNRTLYVCGFGKGVYKSTDNGRTWTLKNRGIAGTQPFAWRMARTREGTLYLVVARRSWRGEIGDSNDGALYRSTDGAENWTRVQLPAGCNGPTDILIDPADERRIAISAWGRVNTSGPDTGGGVFISPDGGASWVSALSSDQHIHDITADLHTGAWFAGGFESSIYRSDDRGQTWNRIRGFNFKWGRRVVPDPRYPGMIFATAFGGSIWYGPAAGDPAALEDTRTPPVGPGDSGPVRPGPPTWGRER